jgi:hypothetical protein
VSIGISKDSVLKYDVPFKTDKFLLLVHGSPDQGNHAKAVIEGSQHNSYTVHSETVFA